MSLGNPFGAPFFKLQRIGIKISNLLLSLREIRDLYFEAKETFLSISQPDIYEVKEITTIFNEGSKQVERFIKKWVEGKIRPSDEELDLLLEACEEASNNFNLLTNKFPTFHSTEDNRLRQEIIRKRKVMILEEKEKRTNEPQKEQQIQERIKTLQSQLDDLKNLPLSSDNETKIRELQKQIDELRNRNSRDRDKNFS